MVVGRSVACSGCVGATASVVGAEKKERDESPESFRGDN